MALPKLSAQQPIVNPDRMPSSPFLQFMEVARTTQMATDERQDAVDQELIEINDVQTSEIDRLDEAVETILAVLGIVNASSTSLQAVSVAANTAQATADEALASGTVSGSADNPAVDVTNGLGWVAGPTASLTSVLAGDLTLPGTGPIQDGDVEIVGSGGGLRSFSGQYRVVEVDGATETVVFNGSFSGYQSGVNVPATINNDSAPALSDFVGARTSTGAIDYRLEFQSVSGSLTSLRGYIFARRAS